MAGDGGQRQQRLLDMLERISQYPKVSTGTLGRWAQKTFIITNRTAQDYIDFMVACKWATNKNTALRITPAGRKLLLNTDDPAAYPEDDPIPTAPQRPPTPPSQVEEGGGNGNGTETE